MLTIQKTNISLTRGDSAYITIVIRDGSGQKLQLTNGDKVRCQVRSEPDSGNLLFEGRINKQGEDYLWYIRPEDTAEIDIGNYFWDA